MSGSLTQPLEGNIHPNNSAPRLGLQHVATMPARITATLAVCDSMVGNKVSNKEQFKHKFGSPTLRLDY